MEFTVEQLLQVLATDANEIFDVAEDIRSSILNGESDILDEEIEYLKDRCQVCLDDVMKIKERKEKEE